MATKYRWVWFELNQYRWFGRIYSLSWSRISWWITCPKQWLSISSRKTCVPYDMSGYSKKIADEYGIKVDDVKKLIPN